MTIREFLRAVWDGKYYVLASLLIVSGAALYYSRHLTPEFEANAVVEVASITSTGDTASQSVTVPIDPSVVTGPEVTAAAKKRLAAEGVTSIDYSVASASGGTNLVSITADAPSARLAEVVANAYAQAYIDYLPTVVNQQVAQLDTRRDALRTRLTQVQAQLATSPKDPLSLAEETAIVAQYTALSTQVTSLQSLVPPAQLLTSASAAVPLGLSKQTILAVGFLAGLIAGIGLALARRGLNFNIRSSSEAARLCDVPVLADLFDVRKSYRNARRTETLPIADRAASPFTESIRELRTSLRFASSGQHVAVLVTAADSNAPRAFIAANLAASWALSGQRVAVFGGDMRRPGLERILPAPDEWSGDERSSRPTRIPNLSIYLPDTPMDPADFLATAALRQLVEDLRDEVDVLVVDAPPVLAAADATILGGYSTSAVLVASIGKTDRAVIREATARLLTNDVPLAGLAVAGASGNRRMSYAATYGSTVQVPWYRRLWSTDRRKAIPEGVVSAEPGETIPQVPPTTDLDHEDAGQEERNGQSEQLLTLEEGEGRHAVATGEDVTTDHDVGSEGGSLDHDEGPEDGSSDHDEGSVDVQRDRFLRPRVTR